MVPATDFRLKPETHTVLTTTYSDLNTRSIPSLVILRFLDRVRFPFPEHTLRDSAVVPDTRLLDDGRQTVMVRIVELVSRLRNGFYSDSFLNSLNVGPILLHRTGKRLGHVKSTHPNLG